MYKFAHAPHELFLCIIKLDVDRDLTLVEAVLDKFSDIQAKHGYYGIDIIEEFIDANNDLNSGIDVVIFYWRK